jgi:L-threonylcarbamoyladenylate synthase
MLRLESPAEFERAVVATAAELSRGGLVALPTETVYGLAANALDAHAVRRIFAVKGRPTHNPLIVHVASAEMARRCVRSWLDAADQLAAAFWPGPLTLVLQRSPAIPPEVTAGADTVAVRWPKHPFVQAVLERCGFPLAAPSANRSNEVSPTRPEHVVKSLGSKVALIVDGGPCEVGIESTVLDLTVDPPSILRPGMIHAESLTALLGELARATPAAANPRESGTPLKSPGLLARHYAPRARLLVWTWQDRLELEQLLVRHRVDCASAFVLSHDRIPTGLRCARLSVIPHDPIAYARALYAELHRCDEAGAETIVVEAPPATREWDGIRDRLRRAST